MPSSQQPRGLPGFLRRTLRNSYEQEPLDSPSSAPGTPVLPGLFSQMNNIDDGDGEAAGVVDDASKSKPRTNAAGGDGDDATTNDALQQPDIERSASGGVVNGRSKKHLRAVAFPPLPYEKGEGDSSDGNDTDSDTAARKSLSTTTTPAKSSDTPTQQPQQQQRTTKSSSTPASPKQPTPPPKSYKETQFESIINSPIISLRDLRKLCWNGIPTHHRPLSWKILLGYLPANTSRHKNTLERKRSEYRDARKQHYDIPDDSRTNSEQETLRQVLVDVPRTAPETPLFHNDRVRRCLSRLLYIWAMRHPASSYVQGINDLATPLIAVFLSGYFNGEDCLNGEIMVDVTDEMLEEVEADTYWCLTSLLAGIQDHYTSDQPGMQRMVMRLEELVNRIDADLSAHLRETGVEFMQFAFKWMNCLLLREFKLTCVMRLWDTYLSEGDGGFEDFHVYVCASFLVHFSNELQQMGFDELFQFMQNMPTDDWGDREIEILLSSAYVLSTLFGGSDAHLNVVRT
mmetsp:Transcript_12975/g.28431  ORF Transcript_12975/g.28431 Transcript_12975/m.28431 type:complete len:514 (-) Transcript_12975:56-1597(-)